LRKYETAFILKATLTDEEIQSKIELMKEVVTNNGGTIAGCENIGMRKLAYEIKKQKRGYYYSIYFEAEGNLIKELERVYSITEDIIRFINIKFEKQAEIRAWNKMVDRANGKTTEKKEATKVIEEAEVKAETKEA
jgi:small subunit ribosomal protein S6